MRLLCAIALCAALPLAASAEPTGLVLSNEDYQTLRDVRRGDRMQRAVKPLQDAGYELTGFLEAGYDDMQAELANFAQRAPQAEALLVVLSGRFLRTPTETFFMPVDAEAGPLVSLPAQALPLSTVLALLSTKPEKAVLVLATDGREITYGPTLQTGIGALNLPEGVTVLQGDPRQMTSFVSDVLTRPGRPFIGMARQKGITVEGYQNETMILLDKPTPAPTSLADRLADIQDWRAARTGNSVQSYNDYIAAHPQGEFVAMAENRLRALTDTPEARAERAEQALDLNRNARREIQRDLSILGFDTRGIDGIFGRGTRAAVSAWQTRERLDATGFLNRDQISLLNEQAELRAAELQAEAEKRREAQRQEDLAYWDQTGAAGDEAGLRAYLKRHPDGEFAELANERLALIEQNKLSQAEREDRDLWNEVTALNTVDAYRVYILRKPDGAFAEEAKARIAQLDRPNQFAEAERAENAMDLSPRTKQVVEARLTGLGLRPGRVDGVFDDDTRRALRRYQKQRNLPETGYMSDKVMVQLMADTVRQIFR